MLGRKVATYSRRKPYLTVREESTDPIGNASEKELSDSGKVAAPKAQPLDAAPKAVETLLASIKELDIVPIPPTKSRKSEIRPRLSVAPSQLELQDLTSRCQPAKEMPFDQWLCEALRYVLCLALASTNRISFQTDRLAVLSFK